MMMKKMMIFLITAYMPITAPRMTRPVKEPSSSTIPYKNNCSANWAR